MKKFLCYFLSQLATLCPALLSNSHISISNIINVMINSVSFYDIIKIKLYPIVSIVSFSMKSLIPENCHFDIIPTLL